MGVKEPKKTRRAQPHMKDGWNRAACKAFGAIVLIVKGGFTIAEAIRCTGSHTNYIDAMKWVVASGDESRLHRVLRGLADLFHTAELVRPIVEMAAAFENARVVNLAGAVDLFNSSLVKSFIAEAGIVTAEEHFEAAVDAFGVDGTLDRLAAADKAATACGTDDPIVIEMGDSGESFA